MKKTLVRTAAVTGSNIAQGAAESVGSRISVQNVTFVNSGQLDVLIKIQKRAATGYRDVTVTNPDNTNGTGTGCFTVN